MLPDLDGLGMLHSWQTYVTWHHTLCHNLVSALICTAFAAVFTRQRLPCATLVFLNWHLHLAADYFGSGGADGSRWGLAYLFPFVGEWSGPIYVGPPWYFNPWQWTLNGWQNLLVLLAAATGWVYIAVRLDRTWFEFVWPRMDRELCQTLRKWFGGQPEERWSEREERWVKRSFIAVTTLALLACATAGASASMKKGGAAELHPPKPLAVRRALSTSSALCGPAVVGWPPATAPASAPA